MKRVGRVSLAQLRAERVVRLYYPPYDVCVVLDGDAVYAIEDACNHAGASLSEGAVAEGCISCPMHGYAFRLSDGVLVRPEGLCDDQRTFRVTEEDDEVVIDDVFELEIR